MTKLRPQYHFRETPHGLDAWDVKRLIRLSQDFTATQFDPNSCKELHTNHWYKELEQIPTPASLLEHINLIQACELEYPIILDANGNVMDGMHRICKALLLGLDSIAAVQFKEDPEPDYRNCSSSELPYDD